MTIPGSANPLLLRSASTAAYTISRSLRFNSSDSAYLSRTPASAGDRTKWTFSTLVKRCKLGTVQPFFSGAPNGTVDGDYFDARFSSSDTIQLYGYSTIYRATSNVFRDVAAWYHIVIVVDTGSATANNRLRIYINNVEASYATINNPAQSANLGINRASEHNIGREAGFTQCVDAYLADIHFIDGQALTPSSFGEFDANNVWQPKAYTGTYGTNGFRLPFSDNSNNTATTLGKDSAGSNNWTPNNFSVTAGAGNDSLVDSPSSPAGQTDSGAGGTVVGNYATLNPIAKTSGQTPTLTNGNLDFAAAVANAYTSAVSSVAVSSGKWYVEYTVGTLGTANGLGFVNAASLNSVGSGWGIGEATDGWLRASSWISNNSSNAGSYGSIQANDVVMLALDVDAGKAWWGRNGTWDASGNPASGTNQMVTFTPGGKSFCIGPSGYSASVSVTGSINFGQRPFAYTAPSGFKALCTANLPEGTITTSGTFTGNANADGPFIWLNGVPTAMTINSNAVTFGTHADKLANGFKLRTNSTSYNTSGSNTYSVTTTGDKFKNARAQANP